MDAASPPPILASSSFPAAPALSSSPPPSVAEALATLPRMGQGPGLGAEGTRLVLEVDGEDAVLEVDSAGVDRLLAALVGKKEAEARGESRKAARASVVRERVPHDCRRKLAFRLRVPDLERVNPEALVRWIEVVQRGVAQRARAQHNPLTFSAFLYVHTHHPAAAQFGSACVRSSAFVEAFRRVFPPPSSSSPATQPLGPPLPPAGGYRAWFYIVFPHVVVSARESLSYLVKACTLLALFNTPACVQELAPDGDWWSVLDVVGVDEKVKKSLRGMIAVRSGVARPGDGVDTLLNATEDAWVPCGAAGSVVDCMYCKKYATYSPSRPSAAARVTCGACAGTGRFDLGYRTRLLAVHCGSVRRVGGGGGGGCGAEGEEASACSSPSQSDASSVGGGGGGTASRKRSYASMKEGAKKIKVVASEEYVRMNEVQFLTAGVAFLPVATPAVDGGEEAADALVREMRLLMYLTQIRNLRGWVAPPQHVATLSATFRRVFPELFGCSIVAFRLSSHAPFASLSRSKRCREVPVEAVFVGAGMYACLHSRTQEVASLSAAPCCRIMLHHNRIVACHKTPSNVVRAVDVTDVAYREAVEALQRRFVYDAFRRPHEVGLKPDGVSDEVRAYYTNHRLVPDSDPLA